MNVKPNIDNLGAVSGRAQAYAVARIFAQELDVPAVDIDDNFFDVGGDSLAAENVVVAVQKAFDIKLQTSVLLEAPTPRELGALVAAHAGPHPARKLIVSVSGGPGEPIAMIHGVNGSSLFANRFGSRLRRAHSLLAIRGMGLEPGENPLLSMDEFSHTYFEALTSVTGAHPRIIGGICMGGLIAMEVGRLTHEATGARPLLLLVDPPPPGSAWLKPMPDNRMTKQRERQLNRKLAYYRFMRDNLNRFGLGGSGLERLMRRKTFKSALLKASAGFVPPQYPCDVLVLASSEWGTVTVDDYRRWATDEVHIKTVVLPGTHDRFREANMDAIDAEIIAFVQERATAG